MKNWLEATGADLMAVTNEIGTVLEGIGHILADNTLTVPIYQRSYAWQDEHIRDLFQDLRRAIDDQEPEYFLGSVVLAHGESGAWEVVDGQQRLATISILLAAMRDYFAAHGDSNRADQIEQQFLIRRDFETQEVIPRLTLNDYDHEFFSKRILARASSARDQLTTNAKSSHAHIAHAAMLAAQHVADIASGTEFPTERLSKYKKYVELNAKVIKVTVPDYANAFVIFETLNARGLELAVSDLLKNYLFKLAQNRITAVQQRWVAMIGAIEVVGGEWLVVPYIRHLWSSIYGLTREKDLYTSIRNKVRTKQDAVELAERLLENAKLYAAILDRDQPLWEEYGPQAREDAATLLDLGMVQMRPLLLAILDKFPLREVQRSLRLLVSWAVRFLIYGGLGGGTLENYYCQAAAKIRGGAINSAHDLVAEMQAVVPSDSQFKLAFTNATVSKGNLARYYLSVLERQANSSDLLPNPNVGDVNLEHVLPQNPSTAWGHLDPESARAYYNRLGNLALLNSRTNSSIGNAGFDEKRKVYRDSSFLLTREIDNYSTWGQDQIEDRQQKLAELAVKAWPIAIRR